MEVIAYHAGLPRDVRAEAQRRFMAGEAPVVVATNAFGMGVDKADVRTVCHESVPSSIEAYYQEAGRAGRDGRPARCLLFATSRDKGLHVFFIERSVVGEDLLKAVGRRIRDSAEGEPPRYNLHINEFQDAEEDAVRAVIGYLARAGVIQPAPSAPDRLAGRYLGTWDAQALTVCNAAAARGDAGALAPVPVRVGVGRGRDVPAARASSATSGIARSRTRWVRAATSAIRGSSRRGRRRSCARARSARPPTWRARSSIWLRGRSRRSGARARSRSCAAGARRRSRSTPTTGCRDYGAYRDVRADERAGGDRRPAELPGACASAPGASPSSRWSDGRRRRHERAAAGRCAGVGRGDEPAGDPRPRPRPRGGCRRGRDGQAGRARRSGGRWPWAGSRRASSRCASYADREARDLALAEWLVSNDVELVVLAGYMQLLSAAFLAAFPLRVVNVHPALLPAFPGIRAVEQALEYGVKVFGVTVHFVDEGIDSGPIILQQADRAAGGDRCGRGARRAAADRARVC